MNPEILSLYGWDHRVSNSQLFRNVITLTVYALLFSNGSLIIPESYLLEVAFMNRFLKNVDPLLAAGILKYAGPTQDIHQYASKKKKEYRDELRLFPGYEDVEKAYEDKSKRLLWIPRVVRSSSADIGAAWREELYKPNGIWRQIIERRKPQLTLLPSKLETDIELVPSRLDDRAFIHRYVQPLLPLSLEIAEEKQLEMLISRAYLESYLDELDAMILVDTPLGLLDCGLRETIEGHLRTFSFQSLHAFFRNIGLTPYIEQRLRWQELILLRDNFVFHWLMNLVIQDNADPNRPFEKAILQSRSSASSLRFYVGKRPFEKVVDHLNGLFDAVEPVLRSYSTEIGTIMDITKPAEKTSVTIKPPRKRVKSRSSLIRNVDAERVEYYKELCDVFTGLPVFHSEDSRRGIAYYCGFDRRLLAQIQFHGSASTFVRNFVRLLMGYGTLSGGEHPLIALLNAVRLEVGQDLKKSIDGFIDRWSSLQNPSL